MKFFFKHFLWLLLIAFICQFFLFIAVKTVLDKNSDFRLTRFFRHKKHDVFVLGNSRAVNSIKEQYAKENLRVDLLNLGFNGMPYREIKMFLDEINSSNSNSTILIEITGLINEQEDNSSAYYMSNSSIIADAYGFGKFKILPLLRLNNEFFLRNIYYLSKSDDGWVNSGTISAELISQVRKDTTRIKVFSDKALLIQRMLQINKSCIASHNKVVFFMAPYFPGYLNKISDYTALNDELGKLNSEFMYVDLNPLQLPVSSFADRVHTNERGASVLTDTLIKLVKTRAR